MINFNLLIFDFQIISVRLFDLFSNMLNNNRFFRALDQLSYFLIFMPQNVVRLISKKNKFVTVTLKTPNPFPLPKFGNDLFNTQRIESLVKLVLYNQFCDNSSHQLHADLWSTRHALVYRKLSLLLRIMPC